MASISDYSTSISIITPYFGCYLGSTTWQVLILTIYFLKIFPSHDYSYWIISPSFIGIAQTGRKSKLINCFRNIITCLSVNVRKELTDIDGKACNNIPEAVNKLAVSGRLNHSCETGWNNHDSSYYSKQNSFSLGHQIYNFLCRALQHTGFNMKTENEITVVLIKEEGNALHVLLSYTCR
jgi:hypothetical protein